MDWQVAWLRRLGRRRRFAALVVGSLAGGVERAVQVAEATWGPDGFRWQIAMLSRASQRLRLHAHAIAGTAEAIEDVVRVAEERLETLGHL